MNLSTSYLGLPLPHPFVVGASPLNYKLDTVRRLEDAGAAAIVMHSLFEEQISSFQRGVEYHLYAHENSCAEATSYLPYTENFRFGPDEYLAHIARLKQSCSMPVIASLNGICEGTWIDWARLMEDAGADALELNLYLLPTSDEEPSGIVEQRCFQIARMVCQSVTIPVAVKLSPYFTSIPHFVRRLETAGARGVVLFNRFLQPDIDVEELTHTTHLQLSSSEELLLRLRWISMLRGRTTLSLGVTGGVHTAEDAVKAIMSGADAIQIVSAILRHGPQRLGELRRQFESWLIEHEYESVSQMKGSMSALNTPNPEQLSRTNYLQILQSWRV